MKCQICGTDNDSAAKYCFGCGGEIELPVKSTGKQRVTLGDYELSDYNNASDSLNLPEIDPAEPIIDRDDIFRPDRFQPHRSGKLFVNLMLIGLLVLIVSVSYFGVNALGKIRKNKEADLIRQVEVQKAADLTAKKDDYLRNYREFIILAQAQAQDINVNLKELSNIENSRWLKNIFLGGIFDGMIEKFTGTESYTAMVDRSKRLQDSLKKLADPPAELQTLYLKAQTLNKSGQSIIDIFTGELDETARTSIAELLTSFESNLREVEKIQ